jgi:hypothetical protein
MTNAMATHELKSWRPLEICRCNRTSKSRQKERLSATILPLVGLCWARVRWWRERVVVAANPRSPGRGSYHLVQQNINCRIVWIIKE